MVEGNQLGCIVGYGGEAQLLVVQSDDFVANKKAVTLCAFFLGGSGMRTAPIKKCYKNVIKML